MDGMRWDVDVDHTVVAVGVAIDEVDFPILVIAAIGSVLWVSLLSIGGSWRGVGEWSRL